MRAYCTYTPGEVSSLTHTHLSCTLGLLDDLSSYVSPTLVSIPSPQSERPWSCWEGGKGSREEKRERGPTLEELLSGGGGQPKGRILVLESGRGEEG